MDTEGGDGKKATIGHRTAYSETETNTFGKSYKYGRKSHH